MIYPTATETTFFFTHFLPPFEPKKSLYIYKKKFTRRISVHICMMATVKKKGTSLRHANLIAAAANVQIPRNSSVLYCSSSHPTIGWMMTQWWAKSKRASPPSRHKRCKSGGPLMWWVHNLYMRMNVCFWKDFFLVHRHHQQQLVSLFFQTKGTTGTVRYGTAAVQHEF